MTPRREDRLVDGQTRAAACRIARARLLVADYRSDDEEPVAPVPARRPDHSAATKGKITTFLLATGWTRSVAEAVDDCGADTDISICHNPARWQKGAGAALCAQHAAQAERWGTR